MNEVLNSLHSNARDIIQPVKDGGSHFSQLVSRQCRTVTEKVFYVLLFIFAIRASTFIKMCGSQTVSRTTDTKSDMSVLVIDSRDIIRGSCMRGYNCLAVLHPVFAKHLFELAGEQSRTTSSNSSVTCKVCQV